MRKILIRFDDVNPSMDWEMWEKAMSLIDVHKVKPLIGVIPDCKDEELNKCEKREDFWEYVGMLQRKGCCIAMHGYEHVYGNPCKSLVGNTLKTEFAGLPYDEQYRKIHDGKEILKSHGIETDIFFAPSHSYDNDTLKALKACGFKFISDGKTMKAVIRQGILCVPCPCGGVPKVKKRGRYTVVIHTNTWKVDDQLKQYNKLVKICEENEKDIVDFYELAHSYNVGNVVVQNVIEKVNVCYDRNIRPAFSGIKRRLLRVVGR